MSARLLLSLPLAAFIVAAPGARATVAREPSRRASLSDRVARLDRAVQYEEAVRAIKRLQHAYGQLAEMGLWHDLADLFADRAVGHYPAGVLTGREAIHKLFLQDVGQGRLGLAEGRLYPHIVFQPVIRVEPNGRTAKGRWHVLAMLGNFGKSATWVGGIYDNDYVKEDGAWKISELRYATEFSGPYDKGWTEAREPRPAPIDATQAGAPVPLPVDQDEPTEAQQDLGALQSRLDDLAVRLQRMRDESEVARLQHEFSYEVDRRQWDQALARFAGNATFEIGQQGVYVGPSSIRRALEARQGTSIDLVNDHLQLQTIVTVAPDGRTARARGTGLGMVTVERDGVRKAQWREGVFENEFLQESGVWKIRSVHIYPLMITDYDKGWGKDAQPLPGPSSRVPPDRPPTEIYQAYPKPFIPRFHYVNPATNRPLQYPQGVGGSVPSWFVAGRRAPVRQSSGLKTRDIERTLVELERRLAIASAFDAAENVTNAESYLTDERGRSKGGFTIDQTVQPIIHVAPDGQSARMKFRVLQVGGREEGADGWWLAGVLDEEAAADHGVWRLTARKLTEVWRGPYHEGWQTAGH